jgi:Phage portal protein, SPP1 Gp6-like
MFDGTLRPAEPGSLDWWLRRLSARLDHRRYDLRRWDDYYRGRLNLALASEKWRNEFAARFPRYSVNFMARVVDKHRERLAVQGIRYDPEGTADQEAWDWWQANHLDAESIKLHRELLAKSEGHVLVWPNEDGEPEVSIESPEQVVVETVPGKSWKRRAALKRFMGDDGRVHAELFTPDGIYKFRSRQRANDFSAPSDRWMPLVVWEREDVQGEAWPIPNPVGVVPIVPFVNRPDLENRGESEIARVASTQDAVNKYRVDAFVAAEFASFRQRWAIGLDIPVDPATGLPVEPFKAAVDRVWILRRPNEGAGEEPWTSETRPEFGEFDVTPLEPFYAAIDGELRMMATISAIPFHDLLPQAGQPPSAESLTAQDNALVAMVLDSMINVGENWEEVFRLNFLMRGDARGNLSSSELLWRDPAPKTESQIVDALTKMQSMGVPNEALWERIPGVTPQTILRWKRLALQQSLEQVLAPAPLTLLPATTSAAAAG